MKKLFFIAAALLLAGQLLAQVKTGPQRAAAPPIPPPLPTREVSGIVKDGTGQTIIGANILLSSKTDTIRTATNADGIYIIKNVKQATFVVTVTSVGFTPFTGRFRMNDVAKRIVMDPIVLKPDSKELNMVNINGTPSIVYKTDTVEYRASDYKVRENSTVDELLKHMEGFEVGSDGSVTHQGQAVTKARLNGKDYAGGNLAQAIQNLPADIVDKVQVVDDYGDQAARTGIKDGDPTKVLNITTLANKSVGNIGRFNASEGSNDRFDDRIYLQRINANEQITAIGNYKNVVNGVASTGNNAGSAGSGGNSSNGGTPGTTTSGGPSFAYRDQLSKTVQVNGSYAYTFANTLALNNSNGAQFTTITNPITHVTRSATTIDTNNNTSHNNNFAHRFTFDYEWQPDSQNYVRIEPTYSYNSTSITTDGTGSYRGLQNETTTNHQTSSTTTPTVGLVATYQYLWKHDRRRNISVSYTLGSTSTTSSSTQLEHILYRDSATYVPTKDSLVNRVTTNHTTQKSDNVTVQYVQPLTKIGVPVQQLLEFNEQYIYRGYTNDKIGSNLNPAGVLAVVDSLSNIYKYSFTQGNFAAQYRRNDAKSQLTLGVRAITTDLAGNNISKGTTTNRTDFYVIPVMRFQYQWTRTEQLSVNYQGSPTEPTFAQIQPVPDYSNNAQNPIFGNPNLKPSFAHVITTRFNDYIANSKFNFSLNSRTTFYQDKITNNDIFIDQLIPQANGKAPIHNIVDQTYFLNSNGAMAELITYNIAKQLNDRAYNLELNGTINYGYGPTYVNSVRYHQTSWDVQERFGPRINPNTSLEINPYVSYDDNRDFTTVPSNNVNGTSVNPSSDIKTTALNLEGKFYLLKEKRFTVEYNMSKNYVQGLTGYNKNPFVMNAYLDYEFFKRKNGILRISAFDIFNQNTYLNHVQSPTGYTNTQSNALSRYLLVSFVLNLQKFSGTPTRNGRPMMRRGDGSFIVN